MDAVGRSAASAHSTSPVRRLLGPRPAFMAIAAVCVVAVVAVLAQLVVSSEHASRTSAEQRFTTGAGVRAQLTASLSRHLERVAARGRAQAARDTGRVAAVRNDVTSRLRRRPLGERRGARRLAAGPRPRSPAASPHVPATCARRSRVARGCPISRRPARTARRPSTGRFPSAPERAARARRRRSPASRSRPS